MIAGSKKGFTLIEMLIVVTIIGILAAIVLPRFTTTGDRAKKNAHKTERQNINSQIEIYHFNTDAYPGGMTNNTDWDETASSNTYVKYFPDGIPKTCPYGTAWVIDTATNRISMTNHTSHE